MTRSTGLPRRLGRRAAAPARSRATEWIESYLRAKYDAEVRDLAVIPRSVEEFLLPLPPAEIRYRVVNRPESKLQHVRTGLWVKGSIESALADLGFDVREFESVLDWGCGCSRVLRHWAPLFGSVRFMGTDIDAVTVEWSKRNVHGAAFAVNGADPPLPCDDQQFDFIYGASVFSHLDEQRQALWLQELRRVLRPNGVLMLSTHGNTAFDQGVESVPAAQQTEFRERGFTFLENLTDGVLPEWYQTAFQTAEHVTRTFGTVFEVVRHYPAGMAGYQDLVVCTNG